MAEQKQIKYRIISREKGPRFIKGEIVEVWDVFFEAPPLPPASVYIKPEEYSPDKEKEEIQKKIKEMMAGAPMVGEVEI